MPTSLATQEAEIRRITVHSQPGQIVQKTSFTKKQASFPSSSPKEKKTGVIVLGQKKCMP
jgi:hypothetical protein